MICAALWRGLLACHAPILRGILGFAANLEECPEESGHGRLKAHATEEQEAPYDL
jgi:hypothetical protein